MLLNNATRELHQQKGPKNVTKSGVFRAIQEGFRKELLEHASCELEVNHGVTQRTGSFQLSPGSNDYDDWKKRGSRCTISKWNSNKPQIGVCNGFWDFSGHPGEISIVHVSIRFITVPRRN